MKRAITWVVVVGMVAGGGWVASGPVGRYLKERNRVHYREAEVTRGKVVAVVNATGTIKPVQSVSVGSFVSGPIESIYVDFNDEVKKGQVLAQVDPKIYKAFVARDQALLDSAKAAYANAVATWATRKAEVESARARHQMAVNDELRAKALQKENPNFVTATEMDKFKFDRMALAAMLVVAERLVDQAAAAVDQAKAQVDQAKASLDRSLADLKYCEIVSPVDGIVIDRKIDPGQTMAAQFQTPELFIVAPDLRKEIRVFASVDEADIGYIREAQKNGQPVSFTVDAYPNELFQGTIFQIRMSSTTVQNVVTYPVVVSAPNPDLKLMPGMTATISFRLSEKSEVLRLPNAALRFYPQREQVRPEDRHILDNKVPSAGETEEGANYKPSAEEKAELRRNRNKRYVWVVDGDLLRAVPVTTGLSDNQYTELVEGDLQEGAKLVIGLAAKR
ncbi:MAG: efflux RND transporter periplasmic adaptor subunit [Gemmataceae bacterium]|nr:efflux RND transporter periplasmic adaptor subunit [Gemmataceae bacterium]